MISGIKIARFRGINRSEIKDLSQVNLFFGKNNCGKSSLLEALFLVCGQSNPLLPASLNAMRAYNQLTKSDIRYFFYKMDAEAGIELEASGEQERHLSITTFQDNAEANDISTELNQSFGLRMNYRTSEGDFSSEVSYCLGKANEVSSRFRVDNRYKEDLKCIYLSPRYDSNASLEGLRNIYTNKDEQFLADALKVLEPNAQNPVFLNNVMLVDVGMSQRIPINLMGDGIRKIVSFLTSIYACRDGVVLIDELSNGFHYSVMKSMWEIVIRAAIRNNVQIFATTHDIDSIRGFQQASAVIENESGRAIASGIKLQRLADDELRAYRFTVQELGYAMEQEMELR